MSGWLSPSQATQRFAWRTSVVAAEPSAFGTPTSSWYMPALYSEHGAVPTSKIEKWSRCPTSSYWLIARVW